MQPLPAEEPLPPGPLCSAQLEFVQILLIVVVMMVMVVVITCLLNHYRLSARSLASRHSQARRQRLPQASDGSLWSSDGPGPSGMNEQQVYTPRPPDRTPGYLQRERLPRFQPTYPYLPHSIIDLPPTISLSDGEEPPPYQGPCTLQLRDPEQQLELNRESVRAPPNRTVFDSHLIDTSASACLRGAPPAYSEVVGHYYHPSLPPRGPPQLLHGVLQHHHLPQGAPESRQGRGKEKRPQQV
ncbi:protein TMEPAI isoform X4 [Conger conger]|uniref:protein TMEPAI isoform X4 n=1 Tax=Conger conger TaxID=82655 RepID=UPI002A5AF337|nr:protein TMEPAI isoform X4 [Conger conger]